MILVVFIYNRSYDISTKTIIRQSLTNNLSRWHYCMFIEWTAVFRHCPYTNRLNPRHLPHHQLPVQVSNAMGMMQPMMRPAMALAPNPAQFQHMMRPGHHPMGMQPGRFHWLECKHCPPSPSLSISQSRLSESDQEQQRKNHLQMQYITEKWSDIFGRAPPSANPRPSSDSHSEQIPCLSVRSVCLCTLVHCSGLTVREQGRLTPDWCVCPFRRAPNQTRTIHSLTSTQNVVVRIMLRNTHTLSTHRTLTLTVYPYYRISWTVLYLNYSSYNNHCFVYVFVCNQI